MFTSLHLCNYSLHQTLGGLFSCKILVLSIFIWVFKDWGCNVEIVISLLFVYFLGKCYALFCFICMNERSKENCDKNPISSNSCK